MINFFNTDKYDDKVFLIKDNAEYKVLDFKKQILSQMEFAKTKKQNVVILSEDNYSFMVNFLASIFLDKEIYLVSDNKRLKDLDFDFDILNDKLFEYDKIEGEFRDIDFNKGCINFYTSGSTGAPKQIKKSLKGLIKEAEDIVKTFNLEDKDLTVAATVPSFHSYGIVFNFILPLFFGLKILGNRISYPENLEIENTIFISTPSFLGMMARHNLEFYKNPHCIFSAGSKLNEDVFNYMEKRTKLIDIYGSTETGIIGYRENYNEPFSIFNGISLEKEDKHINIISEYVFNKSVTVNDDVEIKDNKIYFKSRSDRIYKINDKRISADELEIKLNKSKFIYNSYITKKDNSLVCLCALNDNGKEYLIKNGVSILTKYLKNELYEESEIIPKRWKFIDEIPMTKTGKVNKNIIEVFFDTKLSLPAILNRKAKENLIEYKIFFYKNCDFFKGHFPEFQIVPGVVQLYYAKLFANIYFDLNLGQGQLKKIKFSNYIQPNNIVYLRLEKTDKNVQFEYFGEDKSFSKGVFPIDNIFKEINN